MSWSWAERLGPSGRRASRSATPQWPVEAAVLEDASSGADMIEARSLTKHYGPTVAVDGLTFQVQPGQVTGFLGPNGAGKSTTMRLMLGLDAPTAGSVTVNGRRYRDSRFPLH